MTAPVAISLHATRGATWKAAMRYRDADGNLIPVAGKNALAQVREKRDSEEIILTLSSANGRIILNDADADGFNIRFLVASTDTAALSPTNAKRELVCDLVLYDNASPPEITPLFAATLTVHPLGTEVP